MADKPSVREVWQGKDKARRFYAVEREGATDADDHEAIVVREGDVIRCYRCDKSENIEFKCQHLDAVKAHALP